ncbi:resolvase [Paraliobacillus quinghaiensis]|uniref:Resolvase n=1 Tax=Paraliobacillus quinghaiensis TaxID=470815 RepID=A0A917WWB2_9BACI|nr:recombinase family protein [Paraliobacillus quinghaiensis]GGM34474.1 resolvase [Paraliobacillus quinghaiensis]
MTTGKTFAYIRVSSKEQNEARQVNTMQDLGVHERDIFTDKLSGKNTDRPQYQALKAVLREGDTVIFDSITRMSRNMNDIKAEYKYFIDNGISLQFVHEPMLNTHATAGVTKNEDVLQRAISDIILTLLSAFAEKERTDIRERQAEGIAAAKRKGKRLGHPTLTYYTLTLNQKELFNEQYKRWKGGKQTATRTMDNVGMKKTTFYKVVSEYESLIGGDFGH